jgi:hypothetical protein
LLTYALVEEGLKQGKAGRNGSDIYFREWLDYAVQEVPQLQFNWFGGDIKRGLLDESGKMLNPEQLGLQRPRVFYRREPEIKPFVVAKPGSKLSAAPARE